jgi:hypothetical protein
MCDRRRVLAAEGARSQVLALSNSGPRTIIRLCATAFRHCASLFFTHPLRLTTGTWALECRNRNTSASSFGAIAVSHCEGEGHGISACGVGALYKRGLSSVLWDKPSPKQAVTTQPALCG